MTLSIIPADEHGINNLAQVVSSLLDADEKAFQQSMMTTLFSGDDWTYYSNQAAYLLMEDGSKLHVSE